MKKRIFIAVLLLLSSTAMAQNANRLNCRFQELFLKGDMVAWKHVVDSLRKRPLDKESQLVLLHAEYGLIGNLLGKNHDREAKKEMELFEKRLESAMKQTPESGTLYALSAGFIGFKIALQVWKAPIFGKENGARVKKAVELGANEALPWVELGNSLYFRPAFVGGNKPEAIKHYEKAFSIYKKQGGCNWMYYNIGAWLAQTYANQGNKAKAETLYLQLLSEAPDFDWVRNELLPDLRKGKTKKYGRFSDVN